MKNLLLMLLLTIIASTGFAQNNGKIRIFFDNFEGSAYSDKILPELNYDYVNFDKWYCNTRQIASTYDNDGYNYYSNVWTTGWSEDGYNISGNSLGITAAYGNSYRPTYFGKNKHFEYVINLTRACRGAIKKISTAGLRNIHVNFDIKIGGSELQYLRVSFKPTYDGTVSGFINMGNQGPYNDGKYHDIVGNYSVYFPDIADNKPDFQLGFVAYLNWDGYDDYVNDGNLCIDNVSLWGCPCEGRISSPESSTGQTWVKTEADPTTTLSVEGTHPQAKFKWEASTTGPDAGFVEIPNATSRSYATPADLSQTTWFRCKVWYSNDCCPGVYQLTSFKVEVPEELPVTYLNLAADCYNEAARISWSTATETNNDYFVVERSTDGTNFVEIDRQSGAGTDNHQHDYSFVDRNASAGNNYYRLTQFDYDGHHSSSDIVVANCNRLADQTSADIRPNPASDKCTLVVNNLNINDLGTAVFAIFDNVGRKVLAREFTPTTTDFETEIDISFLPPAVYNYRLIVGDFVKNGRLAKK